MKQGTAATVRPREAPPEERQSSMLKVSSLSKSFLTTGTALNVLRGVDLEVPSGSFFTLLGASGCGKTTLLRCVAGLERPDQGTIVIDGREMFVGGAKRRFVRPEDRPIAMVFQSYAIWPHMTVAENAAYPLKYGRFRPPRRQIAKDVEEMLERVGLGGFGKRWATELSGGQQQRLAVARALLGRPKLLLLDEPLSNLDAKLRIAVRAELKTLQREFGVTTLFVTHDMHEALALSDSVAVVNSGCIEQIGTPAEVYGRPATRFVAQFVGESNLLEGRVTDRDGVVAVDFGELRCDVRRAKLGDSVGVCVRPEDIRVVESGENTFQGRVQSLEFLGEYVKFTVTVGGTDLAVKTPRSLPLTLGDPVCVQLPRDATFVVAPSVGGEVEEESVDIA